MCPVHHDVIDANPEIYTVERLLQIKTNHEAKHQNGREPTDSIVDEFYCASANSPKTLNNLAHTLKWDIAQNELQEIVPDFIELIERLKKLPRRSRELLAIIVQRAKYEQFSGMYVLATEIVNATGLSKQELVNEVAVLDRHGFACIEELQGLPIVEINSANRNWLMWDTIQEFCLSQKMSVNELVVALNFDYFD
jgi:hypothetical protein